ncbi:uncharacterized protein LOC110330271 [Mus pahari]|uniref:uncharacterized protein LOC110330271 n=1 Tax=Mus pahari TaxID=10093 RepID=UPI000A30AFBA|nr:uncharacterized protein LOC110330271 [Mus pahari]
MGSFNAVSSLTHSWKLPASSLSQFSRLSPERIGFPGSPERGRKSGAKLAGSHGETCEAQVSSHCTGCLLSEGFCGLRITWESFKSPLCTLSEPSDCVQEQVLRSFLTIINRHWLGEDVTLLPKVTQLACGLEHQKS